MLLILVINDYEGLVVELNSAVKVKSVKVKSKANLLLATILIVLTNAYFLCAISEKSDGVASLVVICNCINSCLEGGVYYSINGSNRSYSAVCVENEACLFESCRNSRICSAVKTLDFVAGLKSFNSLIESIVHYRNTILINNLSLSRIYIDHHISGIGLNNLCAFFNIDGCISVENYVVITITTSIVEKKNSVFSCTFCLAGNNAGIFIYIDFRTLYDQYDSSITVLTSNVRVVSM